MKNPAINPALRAPADDSGSDADTEVVKRKLAEHALVDANGNTVESEEEATGMSYKIVKDKDTGEAVDLPAFIWQSGLPAGTPACMMAIFGAKTLATNESSQARNGKESASAEGQMEAVRERFALIDSGKWVDRTREGVGAKIDKDALAGAVVEVAEAQGKTADYAKIRQKLEDDAAFVRAVRQVPAITTAYAARAGRPTKSLDDVLAGL